MRILALTHALLVAAASWPLTPALADMGGRDAVLVYRGSSDMGAAPSPAPPPSPAEVVGGDRVWIIDPGADSLIGCALERTVMVGGRRVRCARTRLPVGER